MYMCSKCGQVGCSKRDLEKTLPDCPSKNEELVAKAKAVYENDEEVRMIANAAACTEHGGYCVDTRLVEIIKFAKHCGYKKLGLAFCGGFMNEARTVVDILEYNGFEVTSVMCKNGAMPKATIGVTDEHTMRGDASTEVMCNPVGQAMALNEQNVDFCIVLGLCVGHDTLFLKHIEKPATILAVKDRVTAHNPMAAVYCAKSYYKKKFYPEGGIQID